MEIFREEFRQDLDSLEGATDDLTAAVAGLLTLQQQVNTENQQQQ